MNDSESRIAPDGCAYGRPAQRSNKLLTEVGPGTPCGELMRRYWQPIAVSEDVRDLPRKVRILGEDLIVFRDRKRPCQDCCTHAACTAARRSFTAASKSRASAAATTAGCSTWRAAASNNRASRTAAGIAMPCASRGIPSKNATVSSSRTWARPQKKPLLPRYDNLETRGHG